MARRSRHERRACHVNCCSSSTSACEARAVARDSGNGDAAVVLEEGDHRILLLERSVHLDAVPSFGVSDVSDRDVVVLAPEERHRVEWFAAAEDVARRDLPLALRDHPVLDSNALVRMRIRPPRDVARGKDPAGARLEVLVDDDAFVERESGVLGQRRRRTDADAHHDEVGVDRSAAAQANRAAIDRRHRLPEVEHDAVRFVKPLHEASELDAHDPLERHRIRRDHVDVDAARPQRGRDLEADEAGADDNDARGALRALDDRPAVGERAQVENLVLVVAGNGQAHGIGARREQQRAVFAARAVLEADRARGRIDRRDPRSEHELDVPLLVQLRRPHRNPVVLRFSGEIVLREVRTIDRRVLIAADNRDGVRVAFTAQHVGSREARGTAADDDDGRGVLLSRLVTAPMSSRASRARTPCRPAARPSSTRSDPARAREALRPSRG